MDQHIMNSDGLSYVDSRIGVKLADGSFVIADECADTLMEISTGLKTEDVLTKPIRRRLAFIDIVNKGLAPMIEQLEENRDDVDTDQIFHLAMEVLSLLSQPMQCILPKSGHTKQSREVENDVTQMLVNIKRAFLKPELTCAIFDRIKEITEPLDSSPDMYLSEPDCHSIDFVIYFYRNLLYIQEPEQSESEPSMNMMIISLILRCGFKEMCLKLLNSNQKEFWCVSIVQLLSLLFKDNRFSQLTTEGSAGGQEPMEMNRASRSGGSSVVISCRETTSNEEELPKSRQSSPDTVGKNNEDTIEKNDSGNEKDVAHSENGADGMVCSSSSEEASAPIKKEVNFLSPNPVTDSPPKNVASDNSRKNGKVDLDSRDITNFTLDEMIEYLREKLFDFALAFMKVGWGHMIKCIRSVLMNQKKNKYQLEGHYFMWLVQYFLRIAQSKELPFQNVRSCLNIDVISLLLSLSVMSCEDVAKAIVQNSGNYGGSESAMRKEAVMGHVRKNYMTVVALLEFLRAMNYYQTINMGEDDKNYLCSLQNSVVQLSDLRYLFVLLMRQYKPELHTKQYLSDVIVGNHEFLLAADSVMSWGSSYNYFEMHEHISLFATQETMLKYNSILDEFKSNTSGVNNCVFTMMHHVAGDCQSPDVLLQIPIVQNFLNILEMPMVISIPQECVDLMEFVLQQCLGKLETDSLDCIRLLCGLDFDVDGMKEDPAEIQQQQQQQQQQEPAPTNQIAWTSERPSTSEWTQEEEDEFLILFSRFQEDEPIDAQISDIVFEMQSMGINKTPAEVERYIMEKYPMKAHGQQNMVTADHSDTETQEVTLEAYVKYLYEAKSERLIHWVQKFFMEYGYVRSGVWTRPADPVTLHHAALGKPVPLVVYTDWQAAALKDQSFVQFLQLVGFQVPDEQYEGIFPVLPGMHTAKDLFSKARMIGPIETSAERDIDACSQESVMEFSVDDSQGLVRSDNEPQDNYLPKNMWPLVVQRTNMGKNNCMMGQQ